MANSINEFIGIIRKEGKYYNKPSFFVGKIINKLPDLKVSMNNIVLDKDNLLIDNWLFDRATKSFITTQSNNHTHELNESLTNQLDKGDTVIMFKVGEKFAIISKLVSL
ncbi:DUF2577 family protein [Clostridioides difficile]|uniref:DUF2577 family protein n=1 Tax=Clostridioides difficile TaxID=1496 RepID=UPI00097FF3DE|nr:DUF2577 family protein [Clostridioides difficile]MBY1552934.1 DUF2577 domain-containing protein [Clostridioides difficile]SJO98918.1 Uncharacterised protein [Clostridioides difficile]HBF4252627.1 DUF2577 family protein [Clostridioides difficile]HCQ6001809.1 DUF2577 family protein [Clostridioides difficile]